MTRSGSLLGVLAALVVLAGCGSAPSSSPRPSGSPSPSASASASSAPSACPMVATKPLVRVGRPSYAVLYGAQHGLGPGATVEGAVQGTRVGGVQPGAVATDPAGTVPTAQQQTLDEVLPGSLAPLDDSHALQVAKPFTNQTGRHQVYAVYAGAEVWRGTWTQRLCLDPAKGLQTFRGRFTSVGRLTYGLVACPQSATGTRGAVRDLTVPAARAVAAVCR